MAVVLLVASKGWDGLSITVGKLPLIWLLIALGNHWKGPAFIHTLLNAFNPVDISITKLSISKYKLEGGVKVHSFP